jgi:hypothetical protein
MRARQRVDGFSSEAQPTASTEREKELLKKIGELTVERDVALRSAGACGRSLRKRQRACYLT